jgi:hypothetical protein
VKSGVTHKLASLKQVRALIRFSLCSSPQPGRAGEEIRDRGALTPALSQGERE